MKGRKENNLIVIENGQINTYNLDDKLSWEIGRVSSNNNPDIKLHVSTVSRRHGKIKNVDGNWFYVDCKGKNGTVYNGKKISTGMRGRIKPTLLHDGDILIFGGGEEAIISYKTVWSMFTTKAYEGRWRVEDTKAYSRVVFTDGKETVRLENPTKGTVIEKGNGLAIYMGDITYMIGDMALMVS